MGPVTDRPHSYAGSAVRVDSAVHRDDRAGDVAAGGAEEELDDSRDIMRAPDALKRNPCGDFTLTGV